MIPLLLPVELPCSENPSFSVSVPAGGAFGWDGLAGARRYVLDSGFRDPSETGTPADGLLRCPAKQDEHWPDRCEFEVPFTGKFPLMVRQDAEFDVWVSYACSPLEGQPRISWVFPGFWEDLTVTYALAAAPALATGPEPTDPAAAARRDLQDARATLAACPDTRCSDEVTTRRKAIDAVLAARWTVAEQARFDRPKPTRPGGERARITTSLPWASIERTCYDGDTGGCETTVRFYDSTLLVYSWDFVGEEAFVRWGDGHVSVRPERLVLTVNGEAVRVREPAK